MRSYRLLTPERAAEIVDAIQGIEWTVGHSAREHGKVKRNLELRDDHLAATPLLEEITGAIRQSAIPQREYVAACFAPRFSWYRGDGGGYDIHTDSARMGNVRTDLAMTLFLTEPDSYEGGELCIDGMLPGGKPAMAKAPSGYAVVYECWREHWVNPVTRGDRIVAVSWFQSHIPNAEDRELLGKLHEVIDDIERPHMSDQERFAKLGAVHEKLYRRWMR